MRQRTLLFVQVIWLLMAAVASAQAPPVAMVLRQPVRASEIEPRPEEVTRQRARLDSEAFERWLVEARAKQLAGQVQKRLLDAYAERNGLRPTLAEVEPFLHSLEESSERAEESLRRVRQQRIEEIRKKLAAPALDPAERARLTVDLAKWEQLPSRVGDRTQKEGRQMMLQVAQNWKVQRSLYRKHGGRVLVSSFGFHVAIDAQKQFLREEERRGSFEIFDPALRQAFWTAVADESWADGVASGRSAEDVFSTPPWEVEHRRP